MKTTIRIRTTRIVTIHEAEIVIDSTGGGSPALSARLPAPVLGLTRRSPQLYALPGLRRSA